MALLTLADAKAELNIDVADTDDDAEITAYLGAVTDMIERFIGPVENRSVTETVRGGRAAILSRPPIFSIQSIAGAMSGAVVATADVWFNPSSGVIRPKGSAMPDPIVVTYTAGRNVSGASIPLGIQIAARTAISHLWRFQRGSAGAGSDYDDATPVPGMGYAMPNRALQLLAPWRLSAAIA